MLHRLRAIRAETLASPEPPNKNEQKAEAPVTAASTKPLTLDEKIALLTDNVSEIVPGIIMPFSRQELMRIKKRFVSTQRDSNISTSLVSIAICASMPEVAGAPFAKRLLQFVTSLKEATSPRQTVPDQIDFEGFLTTLSILSGKQNLTVKRQVLFRLYDADRDGHVSVDDFVTTLLAVTSALPRAEVKASIARVFAESSPQSGESALTFDAFQVLFSDADIHAALAIAF